MSGIKTFAEVRARCRVMQSTTPGLRGECWEWGGASDNRGTPSLWIPQLQRVGSIGTLAAVIETGKPAERNMRFAVLCSTPHCCNPAHRKWMHASQISGHFFGGKRLDPMHKARISAALRAKSALTEEQVQLVRDHPAGVQVCGLAKQLGISPSYASAIKKGTRRPEMSPFSAAVGMLMSLGGGRS